MIRSARILANSFVNLENLVNIVGETSFLESQLNTKNRVEPFLLQLLKFALFCDSPAHNQINGFLVAHQRLSFITKATSLYTFQIIFFSAHEPIRYLVFQKGIFVQNGLTI